MLAGLEIWRDDVNAKGGLLGRPVKLVYYDDQAAPANAPGIYAKLMSVDKVDLLIGPYSTNVIAASLPTIIQANRTTIGIFGLGANKEFKYPRYFSMNSQGSSPRNYSGGFFELAAGQQPKLDARRAGRRRRRILAQRARRRARERQGARLRDRLRAQLSGRLDRVHLDRARHAGDQSGRRLCGDAAARHRGLVRAASEVQFKPKLIGGALLGLLVTGIKQQLGPLANGYVNNEFYIPAPSLQFTGTREILDEYQKRAPGLGIDPLGFTYPPYAYAAGQILAQGRDRDQVARRREARRLLAPDHLRHRSSARSRSVRTASG